MTDKQMEKTNRKVKIEPGAGFKNTADKMVESVQTAAVENKTASDAVELYNEMSYTIPELAEKINKSVTVTRRYIAAGRFPNWYKDGPYESSRIRVPQRDLDAYIAATVKSNPATASTDGAE